MSRDNATTFESWNITNEANRDTRHWTPEARQELQRHFADYETLRSLENLSHDQPEVFAEIMRENPNDPRAAAKALAKLNQSKTESLQVKAGIKKAAPPRGRRGWDNSAINAQVRNLLNQK